MDYEFLNILGQAMASIFGLWNAITYTMSYDLFDTIRDSKSKKADKQVLIFYKSIYNTALIFSAVYTGCCFERRGFIAGMIQLGVFAVNVIIFNKLDNIFDKLKVRDCCKIKI